MAQFVYCSQYGHSENKQAALYSDRHVLQNKSGPFFKVIEVRKRYHISGNYAYQKVDKKL